MIRGMTISSRQAHKVIGDEFKKLRERFGLSQSQLARAIGYSGPNTVDAIENSHAMPVKFISRFLMFLDSLPIDERNNLLSKLLVFE
jgi:transcriptional regulator with XRE-family HTH domain